MIRLFWVILFIPTIAFAYVAGMDDTNANISPEVQKKLDEAITTYYVHPSPKKVDTVLDIMNSTDLLNKKTAWAPMVGFLTVVFADNKNHVFDWMARNDYNTYAQDIFVAALEHAKLTEAAYVFAQAHQWKKYEIMQLQNDFDALDLKHLVVAVPGHIDTLWGAFFASGDPIYVNEIINVLFEDATASLLTDLHNVPAGADAENKRLAETTLRQYAPQHAPVKAALAARIATEKDAAKKKTLENIAGLPHQTPSDFNTALAIAFFIALVLTGIGLALRRKKKYTHGI